VEGGQPRCIEFWRQHTYVYQDGRVQPHSQVTRPPSWY
jgi:hypothetical protein